MTHRLSALVHHEGTRADAFIASNIEGLTRNAVQQLIEDGLVLLKDKPIAKSYKMKIGDELLISLPPPREIAAQPEDIALDIVFEDEELLVVNKPKGMVVHPAAGNPNGTLVNALLHHCMGNLSGINGEIRPGIVHRIDKDTSGLLVVAKTNEAHLSLSQQLSQHSMTREYRAVVYGRFKENKGFVDNAIGRSDNDRKKFSVNAKNSKNAYTEYEVIDEYRAFTQLALKLHTGRTHQIRVHMASIGHPLAGDVVYGPKKAITALNGQCLHAKTLGFIHPKTKIYMEFNSELPNYFTAFVGSLQKD